MTWQLPVACPCLNGACGAAVSAVPGFGSREAGIVALSCAAGRCWMEKVR